MLVMKFDATMKAKIKMVSRSRLNLKCPKHSKFNPAEGAGAIRGACPDCFSALNAYGVACNFRQALAQYIVQTEKYETSVRAKNLVSTN
jgi:hypothetical protein